MGCNIRLILILPYRNQDDPRPEKAKGLYGYLRESADEVRYISKTHISKCVEIRSEYMVEYSTHCICALLQDESDVGHVVRYAKHKNLHVVNIASP